MTHGVSLIPHSRPTLGEAEAQAVASVLASGQVAQGPQTDAFERAVAELLGVRGGVAVSSGTVALEVALLALGIGPGDEVLLPTYVCVAPWLAVTRVGAIPKLVEIERRSCNIDPAAVRKALSPRTRAVIVPHLFGLPADLTALESCGIPLIEDCAQTVGALERGRRVGSVGRVTICSFYATKLLCAGEGGMVLSNDAGLLEKGRSLRTYDEGDRLDPRSFNRKMTDLQAALGLVQVNRFHELAQRRAVIAARYGAALGTLGLTLPAVPDGRTHVYYRYVVRIPESAGPLDGIMQRLEGRGVQCRRPVFRPIHQYLGASGFSVSDEAHARALSLPIYPSLTDAEVASVIQALCEEFR
ncbi:MAG: DegT/DnrJ/EryC1/StrS family aminotransferase [Nitrospirae bacterium]|nr:MAG: DegT/DnrJ/EryC1/StrS family aminotransferase [Nitrospirota bacterium]